MALAAFVDLLTCEGIASFVQWIARMTFGPVPMDLVDGDELVELAPEILVFDGLLVHGAPAPEFPEADPLLDALAEVLGIGVDIDAAGMFEGAEGFDGGL